MKGTLRWWTGLLVVAGALVIAGLLLAACGSSTSSSSSPSSAGTPKPGGTYNFALGSDPVAIDPLQSYEDQGMQVVHQSFQGLVQGTVDSKGNIGVAPCIASSWDTTDNQTWTFHLKQGVTFAPPVNREVTAQDFVDSWNWVTTEKNGSPVSYILAPVQGIESSGYQADALKGITGVTAVDKYTLQVKLQYPFADFVLSLLHPVTSVQPVDYIKKIGYKAYSQKPVGTGPYMVSSWQHKQSVQLVKNPSYWDKANAGYVDNINMPIIVSTQTSWLEFQKGAIDFTHVPPGQVRASQANPNVTSGKWTAKGWPYITTDYVGFNMNDKVVGGSQNLDLRKALYMSTDAQSVINIVAEGQAVPATGINPQGMPGWVANLSPYKTNDTAGAKAILANLTVPTLNYWYNTDESNQKTAEVLQAGWKGVGVNTTLSNFEWATFLDKVSKGQGQVYRQGWIADYPSLDNFLYPLFQSQQPPYNNMCFYKNTKFDSLLEQARGTKDQQQRWDLYHQAETMLLTDAPVIPIDYPRAFRVTNNRIAGFYMDPQGFINMWKLWVK